MRPYHRLTTLCVCVCSQAVHVRHRECFVPAVLLQALTTDPALWPGSHAHACVLGIYYHNTCHLASTARFINTSSHVDSDKPHA